MVVSCDYDNLSFVKVRLGEMTVLDVLPEQEKLYVTTSNRRINCHIQDNG